jgi:DNA topoisomerase-1
MDLAQQLFEKGLISYHRTDNVNVAESTYEEICDWLKCNGFDYQRGQRRWKSKANAQEAHEAIRPVDFNVDTIEGDSALQGIYSLIRDRALMSQMPSAMVEQTRIVAVSGASVAGEGGELVPVQFRASGTRELSPGFRAFKPAVREETEDKDEQQLQCAVQEGEVHPVVQAQVRDKRTEPPKRFTEASLVKKLESLGIGRPATYASILGNVIGREYMVVGKDMKITATDTGITVVEALRQQAFLDYGFTSTLEDRLDHICEGKETYLEVVRGLYDTLQRDQERISVPRVGEGGAQASQASVACPECGLAVKRLPAKQRGEFFWVHVDTEHAEGCQKYLADVDGQPQKKGPKPPTPCPSCGKALKRLPSKQYAGQFFWVHQDAKNAEGCVKFLDDKKGRPVVKRPASSTEATCPRCGQPVIQKKNHQSGDPFWVHRDDPATCVKYLPDENGKPGIKSSRTTA